MLFRLLILVALLSGAEFAAAQSLTERLSNAFGGNSVADEILDPEFAFLVETEINAPESIQLLWRVEDGYYLYRDKFKFAISEGPAQIKQARVEIPAGKMKEDPSFGMVEINTGDFSIDLPLQRSDTAQSPLTLAVHYQGCKEDSVCYPPITKQLSLLLP